MRERGRESEREREGGEAEKAKWQQLDDVKSALRTSDWFILILCLTWSPADFDLSVVC